MNELQTSGFLPIEQLELPGDILLQHGKLRAANQSPCLINAGNDIEAIEQWLSVRSLSDNTYRSYRREAERLLLWSVFAKGKPLSGLDAPDYADYLQFIKSPSPSSMWCSNKPVARGEPGWKPFRGPLSGASQKQAIRAINALLTFLCQANYICGNPLALTGGVRATTKDDEKTERFLPRRTIPYVIEAVERLPRSTKQQNCSYHTNRWMVSALYGMGMRATELESLKMNSFYSVERPTGRQWWCKILGKGDKLRRIPVPCGVMKELGVYRAFLGLSPTPGRTEDFPAIQKTQRIDSGCGMAYAEIYRRTKKIMAAAAALCRDETDGYILSQASPHWLRHSFATHRIDDGEDISHVSGALGHSSREVTSRIYTHLEDDAWYEDAQGVSMDWS